jgi:hypothetical protein
MKKLYIKNLFAFFFTLIILLCCHTIEAQCPAGHPPGSTAYDTTIVTPPGVNTMLVKFPQFDPSLGMVTCVKLCISITGVVDSLSVENNSASPQIANIFYTRTDSIFGPGLASPLTNNINYSYPPFILGATDGTPGSGPDFASISHDTLLNASTQCGTISDSAALSQFYGHDSVTYTYKITAFTIVSCTGGNYNSTVATSAFVHFHFEYCSCPGVVLPLNIKEFFVNKMAANKAELKWSDYDNTITNYRYEAQVSRDGIHFTTIGSFAKNTSGEEFYRMVYTTGQNESGRFFFRVKEISTNGYTQYSTIKQVMLESSVSPKFNVFPNPSSGIVGIKFDNIPDGQMMIQIYNTQGQSVWKKEIVATGSSYQEIARLSTGMYWLKLTDLSSKLSSVNQLFIK